MENTSIQDFLPENSHPIFNDSLMNSIPWIDQRNYFSITQYYLNNKKQHSFFYKQLAQRAIHLFKTKEALSFELHKKMAFVEWRFILEELIQNNKAWADFLHLYALLPQHEGLQHDSFTQVLISKGQRTKKSVTLQQESLRFLFALVFFFCFMIFCLFYATAFFWR